MFERRKWRSSEWGNEWMNEWWKKLHLIQGRWRQLEKRGTRAGSGTLHGRTIGAAESNSKARRNELQNEREFKRESQIQLHQKTLRKPTQSSHFPHIKTSFSGGSVASKGEMRVKLCCYFAHLIYLKATPAYDSKTIQPMSFMNQQSTTESALQDKSSDIRRRHALSKPS